MQLACDWATRSALHDTPQQNAWLVALLVLKVNAANANDVILVRWVVQRAIQRPIVADGRHHDDAVAGDFPNLQPARHISGSLQTGPLNHRAKHATQACQR